MKIETLVLVYKSTRRYNQEDKRGYLYYCDNLSLICTCLVTKFQEKNHKIELENMGKLKYFGT
jgi:hypothetical protein